jgi:hypothetical protein
MSQANSKVNVYVQFNHSIQRNWLEYEDGLIPKIARSIVTDSDLTSLPVLADALEEAGCDNELIITNLREHHKQIDKCWAVYHVNDPGIRFYGTALKSDVPASEYGHKLQLQLQTWDRPIWLQIEAMMQIRPEKYPPTLQVYFDNDIYVVRFFMCSPLSSLLMSGMDALAQYFQVYEIDMKPAEIISKDKITLPEAEYISQTVARHS